MPSSRAALLLAVAASANPAADPNGRVTGFVERRESWDIQWKRAAGGG
jgi:hypothetical protein